MMIQNRGSKDFLTLVYQAEDIDTQSQPGTLYVAQLPLSQLENTTSPSWSSVKIEAPISDILKSASVGSCYGYLREGQKLLDTLVLRTIHEAWIIDLKTGLPIGEAIIDTNSIRQPFHVDPSLISNAGVITRVGSKIMLSWDMLEWNTHIEFENNLPIPSKHKRHSIILESSINKLGLTILNNRIFTISYGGRDKKTNKEIYELCVVDINKIDRSTFVQQ